MVSLVSNDQRHGLSPVIVVQSRNRRLPRVSMDKTRNRGMSAVQDGACARTLPCIPVGLSTKQCSQSDQGRQTFVMCCFSLHSGAFLPVRDSADGLPLSPDATQSRADPQDRSPRPLCTHSACRVQARTTGTCLISFAPDQQGLPLSRIGTSLRRMCGKWQVGVLHFAVDSPSEMFRK